LRKKHADNITNNTLKSCVIAILDSDTEWYHQSKESECNNSVHVGWWHYSNRKEQAEQHVFYERGL